MHRFPSTCPTCGGPMVITEMSCTQCTTTIRGVYSGCTFCGLGDDDLRFLELFVASRGNVKEMERETGLGYWTIRGHVNDLIEALRLSVEEAAPPVDTSTERQTILDAVARGELSVAEAEQQLLALAKKAGSQK